MNKKYVNRKTCYSAKDRTASQYKIMAIPIQKDLDKEDQKKIISTTANQENSYLKIIKEINFSAKVSQRNVDDLLCSTIVNIGLIKDKTKNLSIGNTKETNFLFIDFEEDEKKPNKKVLSFDECIRILEDNELNYILTTSYSHTEEKPRLHLFLPLLKPIKSDEEYKYNLQLIKDTYFSNFHIDESTKNINRWVYSSKSENLQYSYCFVKNDINPQKIDKHLIDVEEKIKKRGITFKPSDKHIQQFAEQVENLYGFKYAKYDSNGVIKFYRDEHDKTPNVWYSSSFYDSETNKYTIYDKKEMYNVLFSYEDFQNSINPKEERDAIQEKMGQEFENWFIDGGKIYVVTNEGLGKSSTVRKMGKSHNFIFACHTKERVKEISKSMTKEGIDHSVILSNSQILKELASSYISKDYEEKISKNKKLGFKNYINRNIHDDELKDAILAEHKKNSQNLKNTNTVRIVTSRKLQVEIEKANRDGEKQWLQNDKIIFDEFILDEWASYGNPEGDEETVSKLTIWNKKDSYVSLVENKSSFQKLLRPCPSVLVLTTERSLIELIFDKSNYTEMIIFEITKGNISLGKYGTFGFYKLERKLFDENVIYILTNSTRGEIRDELIQSVKSDLEKEFSEDFTVISNNAKDKDVSHVKVKGSNDYTDNNTLIIGTLRTEIEDNILYYSAEEYFTEFRAYIEEQHKNLTEEKQTKKANTAINTYIKQVQLLTQVSQSIGRNSGFRDIGKKAVVVLPILQPNSTKNFKSIDLNYISPNVSIYNKEDKPKETKPDE